MATVNLQTDEWLESSSTTATLSTDEWLSSPVPTHQTVTLSTDEWLFNPQSFGANQVFFM